MATMTVSLPDPMKRWIEAKVAQGGYASASDYFRDLVRRDPAWRDREYTLEELQQLIDDSRASGISDRSVDEIFAEAERIYLARHGK